jgi:hypothetical protein
MTRAIDVLLHLSATGSGAMKMSYMNDRIRAGILDNLESDIGPHLIDSHIWPKWIPTLHDHRLQVSTARTPSASGSQRVDQGEHGSVYERYALGIYWHILDNKPTSRTTGTVCTMHCPSMCTSQPRVSCFDFTWLHSQSSNPSPLQSEPRTPNPEPSKRGLPQAY